MSDVASRQYESVRNPANPEFTPPPRRKTGGHDVVLGALQQQGKVTTIVTTAGEEYKGLVRARDPYTITLEVEGVRRIFYKHAIEQFFGESYAPAH